VSTEHSDPLCAEAARGDDAAKAYGAVADHSDNLARTHSGRARSVVTGAHDVGKRQQRRHQSVISTNRKRDQRAVGKGDAHGFALAAIELSATPPSAVQTRRLQSLSAELARAVGSSERGEH
jgi:hypothetical protein